MSYRSDESVDWLQRTIHKNIRDFCIAIYAFSKDPLKLPFKNFDLNTPYIDAADQKATLVPWDLNPILLSKKIFANLVFLRHPVENGL